MAIPGELKNLNIKHFQRRPFLESDPEKWSVIERLLAQEQAKDNSAYPSDPDDRGDLHPPRATLILTTPREDRR
jgi:hypothetical protein